MTPLTNVLFVLLVTTCSISNAQDLTSAVICNPVLDKCYQYFLSLATFLDAELKCEELGGHLTSIHSEEENVFVAQIGKLIQPSTHYDYYWIGATRNVSGWEWTDGTSFNYSNWATNPTLDNASQHYLNRTWVSTFPTIALPFICSVPAVTPSNCQTTPIPTTGTPIRSTTFQFTTITAPSTTPKQCVALCESGWTYFAATDSCYKVFHNAKWSEAEVQCVSYEAHLTSIHSDTENTFVNNLASTGNKRVNATSLAWIGMQSKNGQWIWSDGSKMDYFQWAPKQPDNLKTELCVQTAADLSGEGWYQEWNNLDCKVEIRAFICKKAAYYL